MCVLGPEKTLNSNLTFCPVLIMVYNFALLFLGIFVLYAGILMIISFTFEGEDVSFTFFFSYRSYIFGFC